MNLLGATLYDPAVAVTKNTTAAQAMTAIDTTNLRIAFTVPSHGKVRVKMMCTLHGATTFPSILLGVLEGSTLRGRQAPLQALGNTAVATAMVTCLADYIVTGLTPGAVNWDAAYGVETLVASTGIKYGGPNDTTVNNAFGGFSFEVWDPQPIPTAAPGAANGLPICGANAAITYASMTVTAALSVNGVSAVSQTGDSFARLGAPAGASHSADVAAVKVDTAAIKTTIGVAGAGLTALGDTRIANLDAAVSSRSTFAGGAVASVSGNVGGNVAGSVGSVVGAVGSVTGLTVGNLDAAISTRLAAASSGTPPTAAAIAGQVWDIALSGHLAGGSTGYALNGAGGGGGGGGGPVDLTPAAIDSIVAAIRANNQRLRRT